jgi:hypothetical protein
MFKFLNQAHSLIKKTADIERFAAHEIQDGFKLGVDIAVHRERTGGPVCVEVAADWLWQHLG